MAHGDYIVFEEEKPKRNLLDRPEGFVFDNEQSEKYGQLVTVRVKAEPDDETKLCVTEIEGIPLDYEEEESTEE